jgi:hypothetical protein
MDDDEIKKIIKEELGVSNEVINISKDILKTCIEMIKDAKVVERNDILIKKSFNFNYKVNDNNISITVYHRNFLNNDLFTMDGNEYITNGASILIGKNHSMCILNIFSICGTLQTGKAMETIQHEVEHIYQTLMMGKNFGGEMMYAKIKTDLESGDDDENKIGNMMYLSLKSEQEGFANGLYAYMMDKPLPYSNDLLIESETWKNFQLLKQLVSELETNENLKKKFSVYFEKFGITIKDLKQSIRNFSSRIGKVIIKVKNDKIKQGWRF